MKSEWVSSRIPLVVNRIALPNGAYRMSRQWKEACRFGDMRSPQKVDRGACISPNVNTVMEVVFCTWPCANVLLLLWQCCCSCKPSGLPRVNANRPKCCLLAGSFFFHAPKHGRSQYSRNHFPKLSGPQNEFDVKSMTAGLTLHDNNTYRLWGQVAIQPVGLLIR